MNIYKINAYRQGTEFFNKLFVAETPKGAMELYWEYSFADAEWPDSIVVELQGEANMADD